MPTPAPLLIGCASGQDDLMTSGTTTLSEDLQEYLSNAVFDPLRMRDDFCALLR